MSTHQNSKKRHHHHHYNKHPDTPWVSIIFLFLFIGVFLVIFLVPWPYYYPPPPPPPSKEEYEGGGGVGGGGEGGGGAPFVFRKKNKLIAQKRSDRNRCKSGERWSPEEGMCEPIFNTPSSFEGSIMNVTMNMCDDFFNAMCGKWNAEHTNEDRTFSYGYHRNQNRIRRIVQNPTYVSIRSFYDSCITNLNGLDTHESQLETQHVLEHIANALKGYGDLPTVLGRLSRYGYTSPFVFSIERDPTQKRLVPFFTAGSFNFSSPVVMQTFETARSITKHTSLVLMDKVRRTMKVINHLNQKNTEPVEGIVDYMDYLRSGGINDDMHLFRDLGLWNTPHENSGGWTLFFQALDGSALRLSQEQPVWIIGLSYMKWLLQDGLRSVEVMDWVAFVEFSILYNTKETAPILSNNVYLRSFSKSQTKYQTKSHLILRSLEETQQKELYCVEVTQNMIPGLVAQTFLNEMMPNKELIRTQVKTIVSRIIAVYRGFIQSSAWLKQIDKDAALRKLDTLIVRVVEPDEWEAEPFAQRISKDRYTHNMNMVRRYRVHRNIQQWHLNKEPELSIPFVAPLSDVNAYYSGPSNSITILAGILQKPFYNVDYNEPTRYAIIGSIIGHELGHMFDPHGLLWDENGNFKPRGIWSKEGMDAFRSKSRCVVDEFGDTPDECIENSDSENSEDSESKKDHSYGEATLGEDLADLVGVRLSYKAYFDNTPSATSGQRQYFFMSFAQAWCSSYDVQHTCALVKGDVHAIAEYRVDRTLRNIPEFARVFGCQRKNNTCTIYE